MSLVRRTCGGYSSNEAPFFFFKNVAYLACCRDKMNNCASFFAGVVLVKGEMLENSLASLDDCNNNNELRTDQSQKRAFLLQVSASLKREGLTDYYCSVSCKNVVRILGSKCRWKKNRSSSSSSSSTSPGPSHFAAYGRAYQKVPDLPGGPRRCAGARMRPSVPRGLRAGARSGGVAPPDARPRHGRAMPALPGAVVRPVSC